MKKLSKIVIALFLLISTNSIAQKHVNQHDLNDEKKEKMADKLRREGRYDRAVEDYKEIWDNDTTRYDLKYKMGLSYYFSRNYKDAEPWFQKAVLLEPKAPTLAFYYLGECQRHNLKYAEAKKNFAVFNKVRYRGSDKRLKKKLSSNFIKSCTYAI